MYFNLVSYQNYFFDQNYSCSSYMHQITWERKENGISRMLLNDISKIWTVYTSFSPFSCPSSSSFFFTKISESALCLSTQNSVMLRNLVLKILVLRSLMLKFGALIVGTHFLKTVLNNNKRELPLLCEQQENCETCFLLHQ